MTHLQTRLFSGVSSGLIQPRHGPLTRYVKVRVAHAPGKPGMFSPQPTSQRRPLISDPGLHHSKCIMHVPWCMSGTLTRGGGENVPGIPDACATRNFTYLARGPFSFMKREWAYAEVLECCCHKWYGRKSKQVFPHDVQFEYAITQPLLAHHWRVHQCLLTSHFIAPSIPWGVSAPGGKMSKQLLRDHNFLIIQQFLSLKVLLLIYLLFKKHCIQYIIFEKLLWIWWKVLDTIILC